MNRCTNEACAIILILPKSNYRSACLGFAAGTHIDIPLVDAPAIMGFRIERDTVKFANYKGAATITTALWLGGCAKTMSSNMLVFTVHMITAALCHVLLPFVQMV
ncbi:hypothetical protein MRX96_023882 [Rhipicephalus microplus]